MIWPFAECVFRPTIDVFLAVILTDFRRIIVSGSCPEADDDRNDYEDYSAYRRLRTITPKDEVHIIKVTHANPLTRETTTGLVAVCSSSLRILAILRFWSC